MRHDPFPASSVVTSSPLLTGRFPASTGFSRGAITILQRSLDAEIATALGQLDDSSLPNLRVRGNGTVVLSDLSRGLAEIKAIRPWLREWLLSDIDFLMRMYAERTGAITFEIRLEAVSETMCPQFHADNVRFRLVTTYRGAGTEWVAAEGSVFVRDGQPAIQGPAIQGIVRQLDCGWVAIMRGRRGAASNTPALLHRSPAFIPGAPSRLFLAIDDARDHEARHGTNVERTL